MVGAGVTNRRHVAPLDIARALAPLDSPLLADLVRVRMGRS